MVRVEIVNRAAPCASSVALPNVAPLGPMRSTRPLGVPLPAGPVTLAVKVTTCPGADGFGLDDNAVVVGNALIVNLTGTVCGLFSALIDRIVTVAAYEPGGSVAEAFDRSVRVAGALGPERVAVSHPVGWPAA